MAKNCNLYTGAKQSRNGEFTRICFVIDFKTIYFVETASAVELLSRVHTTKTVLKSNIEYFEWHFYALKPLAELRI